MTTVALVPNATLTSNGIVQGIVGAAHQAVTDASDATYLIMYSGTNGNGDFLFDLSTFTLPAQSIIRSATVTVRGSEVTTDALQLVARLWTNVGTSVATFTVPVPLATVGTVTATSAAVAITDQASIDGLQLKTENPAGYGGSSFQINVYELSVPLVYVTVPTVIVGGPTGTLLTANPMLTWIYTGDPDADGGGVQQRYHVKVFTSTQYGAADFNPATSPAGYDSGDVMANTSSALIGPLENATANKVFMRVAQNVNGAPHWSPWTSGPLFTINVDPPVVATLTATAEVDHVAVTATRDTGHSDWTHVEVERSDGDAVSWRSVRGGMSAPAPDDVVVVDDYEQPDGVALWYRARGLIKDSSIVVAQGEWSVIASSVVWTTTGCGEWLRAPGDPAGAVQTEVIVDEETTVTQHRVGVLDVIGRASPVTVWDVPALPTGVINVATRNALDEQELRRLVRTAPVLLYQGRVSWGHAHRWLTITNHSVSRLTGIAPEFRTWELTYVEVSEPAVLLEVAPAPPLPEVTVLPPSSLSLTPGDTTLAVTWAGPYPGYEIRIASGSWIDKGAATTHTFTGLTNGVVYLVEVRTVAPAGVSAPLSASGQPVVAGGGGGGEFQTMTLSSVPTHWHTEASGPPWGSTPWSGHSAEFPGAAYRYNGRSGDGSRYMYEPVGADPSGTHRTIYGYAAEWADGMHIHVNSGEALIIEWEWGSETWRETIVPAGSSMDIDLSDTTATVGPANPGPWNGVLVEAHVPINITCSHFNAVVFPPDTVSATPGDGKLDVTYSGIYPGYEVRIDAGAWINKGTATSHSFTGLTNGTSYTVDVRTVSSMGVSTVISTTGTPAAAVFPTFGTAGHNVHPSGGNITMNKPAATVAGDLLVSSLFNVAASNPATPGLISGFTDVGTPYSGNVDDRTSWKIAGGSEPATYSSTVATPTTFSAGVVARFTGTDPTTPIDGTAVAYMTTAATLPAVTTTVPNCLAVAFVNAGSGADAPASISGWTNQYIWATGDNAIYTKPMPTPGSTGTTTLGIANALMRVVAIRPEPA